METVLWYQNAEIDKPDGFVIDGEHQFNEDTHIQQEAFTTLINGRKWPKARSLSIMKRRHPNASDQLEIYINQSGELMVQSHFINRDERLSAEERAFGLSRMIELAIATAEHYC